MAHKWRINGGYPYLILKKCRINVGYIDSWGRGTIKIIDACKANNMPEPEMRNEQGGFVTIFHKQNVQTEPQKVPDDITINQKQILALLSKNNMMSMSQLGLELNISKRKILDNINKLKQLGLIKRIGPAKGGHWEVGS